eukprot:6492294-Amphidinium_carterae.3
MGAIGSHLKVLERNLCSMHAPNGLKCQQRAFQQSWPHPLWIYHSHTLNPPPKSKMDKCRIASRFLYLLAISTTMPPSSRLSTASLASSKHSQGTRKVAILGCKAKLPKAKPKAKSSAGGFTKPPAKRVKLDAAGGEKVCSLYKKSSEDVVEAYNQTGCMLGLPCDVGEVLSYMSWDETCTKASESTEFLALVGKARSVKHGHATINALPTSVSSSRKIMLQVERSMIVVSEKELRKEGNLIRIAKSTLKNIPSLTVAAEQGGDNETL